MGQRFSRSTDLVISSEVGTVILRVSDLELNLLIDVDVLVDVLTAGAKTHIS